MRERRKEPREGSEIDPETACIQTVGAPAPWAFGSFEERSESKDKQDEIDPELAQGVLNLGGQIIIGRLLASEVTQKNSRKKWILVTQFNDLGVPGCLTFA